MLQRFQVRCRNLDQRMHIVKILALPVHDILEIHAGGNDTVQLFKILPCVCYITHPAAVHHGLL